MRAIYVFLSFILIILIFATGGLLALLFRDPIVTLVPALGSAGSTISVLSGDCGLAKTLRSASIESILAFGKVVSINGRTLTLSFGEDDNSPVAISVKDGAIVSLQQLSGTKISVKNSNFESIKVGDNVNMPVTISSNGDLLAESVLIIP